MLYTISILLRRASSFLLNIFIARLVSIHDFGEYSQFTVLATYLLLITEFGYNEYILVKSKEKNNLDFLLSNFLFVSLVTALLISIMMLFITPSYLLFLIIVKVYLDTYFNKLILSYYQYKLKFKLYSKINILYSFIIFSFIFALQFINLSIEKIIFYVDIFLLIAGILLSVKSNFNIKLINMKKLLPYIDKNFSYYALSSITIPIYMLMPLFIMTYFISKEEIAIFYLAYTISSVLLLVSISINQQYLPKLIHSKNENFYKQIKSPIILLIFFNFFIFFIFYFFGEYVLSNILNKARYIESNKYILLLMISNTFQSVSGLIALYLVSNNLMKEKLFIHIELIIFSFLVSIILIYYYGIIGIAYSYIILYMYTFIRYVYFINIKRNKLNNE